MPDKVMPIAGEARVPAAVPRYDAALLADTLGRPMRDLRISVTDRCNFRCVYCMPREVFDGEPLRRKDLPRLVTMVAPLGADLTLTTNGSTLVKHARARKNAGLHQVTVSLDSLDEATSRRMNDADFPVSRVLEGIASAAEAGLAPIKINMVVKRGINDGQIVDMARLWRHSGHIVRFIEFMDVVARALRPLFRDPHRQRAAAAK